MTIGFPTQSGVNIPTKTDIAGGLEVSSLSLQLLNDRFRRIGSLLNATNGSSASSSSDVTGANQIVLSVPGILAVQSDVAPIIQLAQSQSFSQIFAAVKQAPIGSPITLQIYLGGLAWGPEIIIATGLKSVLVTLSGLNVAANTIIRLDVTGVGALLTGVSFPGSDLTVILS